MFVCMYVTLLICLLSEYNIKVAACTQKKPDLERPYPLDHVNV